MTKSQLSVAYKVIIKWREGGHYYRAQRSGERVTLASLFRADVLTRRVWRGKPPYEAHEYRPSNEMLTELAREAGVGSTAELMPATTGMLQAIARKVGRL
jgi:hypothetical protein